MILPLQSSVSASGTHTDPRWWVIHTRPRCEKKMDEWLAARGLNHYLPTRPRLRVYPGKRVVFQHPLFPNYAFGSFSLLQRNEVYSSNHAAAILEVSDQKQLEEELGRIRQALDAGLDAEECPYLTVGRKARITAGKLRGLEGLILRRGKKAKMILSVELLQRSVSVEVDAEMLEPAV